MAIGDVTGDGRNEVVGVRNYDGDIFVWRVNPNGTFTQVGANRSPGSGSKWAGLAVGDVTGDGRNEVVGVRNYDGDIFVWRVDPNGTFTQVGANHAPGSGSEWAGLAIGDIVGDSRNEVVGVRNYDGNFYIWQVAPNGTFTEIGAHVSPGSGSRWAGIEIGNVTGAGNEIVGVRNADGDLFVLAEAQQEVDVSVKWILDAQGSRPTSGFFTTNAQIQRAIDDANTVLANNNASWRLNLREILDVANASQYRDMTDAVNEMRVLEMDARQNPGQFFWRTDAINIYVLNSLDAGGVCSFPAADEVIVINNSGGILNGGAGWLHEIGHYLSLFHTFECFRGNCDQNVCMDQGAGHDSDRGQVMCEDVCPDTFNFMSYNAFTIEQARISDCQLTEMEYELCNAGGSRGQVLRRTRRSRASSLPALGNSVAFRRGDSNGDATVNVSDPIHTVDVLLFGQGAFDCPDAADADDDGAVTITDVIDTFSTLMSGGDFIAPPGPFYCSPDSTADDLAECEYRSASCPVVSGPPGH